MRRTHLQLATICSQLTALIFQVCLDDGTPILRCIVLIWPINQHGHYIYNGNVPFLFIPCRADAMIFKKLDFKRLPVTPDFRRPKSSRRATVLRLFRFRKFFPIFSISASTKIITSAIYSTRTAATKLEIMEALAFDDISTFLASDCIFDNSRHNHFPINAFPISSAAICTQAQKKFDCFFQTVSVISRNWNPYNPTYFHSTVFCVPATEACVDLKSRQTADRDF